MDQDPVAHTRRPAATAIGLAALILILAACSSVSNSEAPASEAPASEAAASEVAASEAPASQPAASEGGSATTVIMSGLAFEVAEITVPVGDVTFVNEDSTPHLIAEGENGTEVADPRVQKVSINAGEQGDVTFSAAGDYNITCLIHPQMNMVVHVE